MKALGNLLMTVSLIVGVLAAATSYFVPVANLSAESEAELAAVAGRYAPRDDAELDARIKAMHNAIDEAKEAAKPEPLLPPEEPVELSEEERFVREIETEQTGAQALAQREQTLPFGRTGDPVDANLLELLNGDQDAKLKVKSFEFTRWQHWWLYLIACLGLAGGATLVRIANKKAIEQARTAAPAAEDADGAAPAVVPSDPAMMLASTKATVANLRESLKLIPSIDGRMAEIRDRLGGLQRGELMDFVASRERLVAQLGLGGYAALMDQFSAAERQINRAWSAAADGVQEEAISCLALAEELVGATEQKFSELSAGKS